MPTGTPKLYLLCGLSFAGKSSLARKLAEPLGATIVEADTYIAVVAAELPGARKIESWRAIQKLARGAAGALLKAGTSVLYDDLMVDPSDRAELVALAEEAGAEAITIFLATPVEVVRERQRQASAKPEKHAKWDAHTRLLLSQLVPPERASAVYVYPDTEAATVVAEIKTRFAA